MPKEGTKGQHYRLRDREGHCPIGGPRPLPVGARLARESDRTANIYVGCDGLFAGKPRSHRFMIPSMGGKTTCLVWSSGRKPG
ncbi:hypothetical protein OU5_3783 [Pseudomonas mandelii JR-1]|uniref:Uncharacterized protein n=1 Tax=Pseudomonas mandelii JR-1 TaxID=1147786 RepID=A0A024EDI7_9PSED|nr:hypothetical protein OU5_3783 [Pseudomonas mandelii JR-1]